MQGRYGCSQPGRASPVASTAADIARRVWVNAHRKKPRNNLGSRRGGLIECAAPATVGVTLALQNHPPVINNGQDMLRMIREVGSPALKACFDAPLARKQGVTSMRQAIDEVGSLQVLTHFGGEYEVGADGHVVGYVRRAEGGLDQEDFYADFVRESIEAGYEGYIGYELCHPLPKENGLTAGLKFAERNARLAVEYMQAIIDHVQLRVEPA